MVTANGSQVTLSELATITVNDGPPMLKSENARLSNWIYVDLRGRDLKSAVEEMQNIVAANVTLPQGVTLSWSGQFEYLERATATLKIVLPFTLLIIFILLYITFQRFSDALLIMGTLPFALIGGVWLLWLATIMAGLMPIMWGNGSGSEVMRRIAAPMIGGMITAPLLSMLVIPALYLLIKKPK